MILIDESIPKEAPGDIYVLSSCSFAWLGFEGFLTRLGINATRINVDAENAAGNAEDISLQARDRLLVMLTGDMGNLFLLLKKVVWLLNHAQGAIRVDILCQLPASWVYRMLHTLVADNSRLSGLCITHSRQPCHALLTGDFTCLDANASREEKLPCTRTTVLTRCEFDALLHFYTGISVKQQSLSQGTSDKSIYRHRRRGLRKLQHLYKQQNDVSLLTSNYLAQQWQLTTRCGTVPHEPAPRR